ncbi:MAG: M67 family metallopeptidase [Chloroflexota bacterium]
MTLNQNQWDQMLRHVEQHAPLEACGLLAGKNDQVQAVIVVRNQAQSSVRFIMDPYEQLRAFEWIDSHALELIGIFHSHPAGPETASITDIREATYEVVHIIWSRIRGEWKARGFWLENGQVLDVPLAVHDR